MPTREMASDVFGISVVLNDPEERELDVTDSLEYQYGGGRITSDLHTHFHDPDLINELDAVGDAAADALESFILALACEGYDIKAPAFSCALEIAAETIANNL